MTETDVKAFPAPGDADRPVGRRSPQGYRGDQPDRRRRLCPVRQDQELPLAPLRRPLPRHPPAPRRAGRGDLLVHGSPGGARPARGRTTIRSISHINRLQTIQDDNEEFRSPDEMIRAPMEDNRHYVQLQREAHEVCDDANDVATASLLEDVIDATEKRTWFLYEYLQDTDRFD